MNRSIAHQDAAGMAGAPLAVFHNSVRLEVVVGEDPYGTDTIERVARERGITSGLEVLVTCHIHPETAAVDCTDCVPLED